jgi:Glycoside hydrolase 123 N-terminal domain
MQKLLCIIKCSAITLMLLSGCQNQLQQENISEIKKPTEQRSIKPARTQPALPTDQNWQEDPFIENSPEPLFSQAESRRGYIIFNRPITDIVYPNSYPKKHERIKNLTGFGCKGEFEPLTFSLYPNRKLKNLKVKVSDLKNGNSTIPSLEIAVRLQTYWKIPFPHYVTNRNFKWRLSPELLEDVTVHTSPAKQCQRYWLTVKVPDNAVPGLYKGNVTLWDDGYAKAIKIPVTFQVMSFDLMKDPNKHYSAYYYDYLWGYDDSGKKVKNNKWIMKAAENSYRSMKDHGFDAMPTVYLRYNSKTDKVYARQGDRIMKTAKKAGFKNIPFVPVAGGNAIGAIIRKFDKKFKRQSHWRVNKNKMPNEKIYAKITELFKDFNDEWNAKGYPKIYCCPLDEIDTSSWKFGKKVYAAVKASGMGVYITKSPLTTDAPHYKDVIDAFCSQPYALPYEQVVKSKRLQYWCYPNHNSWEIRRPSVMCNGGRMTYGFGNWRSGHTVLIPWAWSCWRSNTPISYFRKPRIKKGIKTYYTPAGNPADENGNIIPTTYWQCFREGYDDGRYIYTLQKVISERENNSDPNCRKLVTKGKALLQKIWDDIQVEQKYKAPATVSILPIEFNALRWQMAELTENLIQYKGKASQAIPSVTVNTTAKKSKKLNILAREQERGNLIIKNLGDEKFDYWKSVAGEAKITITDEEQFTGGKSLKLTIKVDHKTDGGGEKGKYPVGWPRIRSNFKKNKLDLTKYEFINFYVMVDSNRDEVADDNTPAYWTFGSHIKGNKLPAQTLLGQIPQRTWIQVMIPLNKIIDYDANLAPWKSIESMQFGIGESKYNDGTNLTFYIDNIALINFKTPILEKVIVSSTILLPTGTLYCKISSQGTAFIKQGEYKLKLQLINKDGVIKSEKTSELKGCKAVSLKLNNIKQADYTLKGSIIDKNGKTTSIWEKTITAINGPGQRN